MALSRGGGYSQSALSSAGDAGREVSASGAWRIAVNTELKSADQWSEDWGFLVAMQQQSAGKQQQCKVINLFPSVRSAQRKAADKGRTDKNIGGEDQQLEGQVDV